MSENTDLLRVAPLRERNSATNRGNGATPTATANATATLKALARKAQERNSQRNSAQQGTATSATNTPPETPCLLRTVAMVPDEQLDPLKWPRFVALCEAQGVGAEQVQSMFTERDIDDLCEQDDTLLPKFADTIVQAIKRAPTIDAPPPARIYQERHRCGRCQHYSFNPATGSTGLGWCNVRTDVSMALPSRLIECDHYQQRTPTP